MLLNSGEKSFFAAFVAASKILRLSAAGIDVTEKTHTSPRMTVHTASAASISFMLTFAKKSQNRRSQNKIAIKITVNRTFRKMLSASNMTFSL